MGHLSIDQPDPNAVPIELSAVIVAVTAEEPRVLTIRSAGQEAEALPTDHRSDLYSLGGSSARPSACSGDMYAAVPTIIPCEVMRD